MTKMTNKISIQQKMKTYLDLKKGLVFPNSPLRKSALPSSLVLGGAFLTALPTVQVSATIIVTPVNKTLTSGYSDFDIDDDGNNEMKLSVGESNIYLLNFSTGIRLSGYIGAKTFVSKLASNATIQNPTIDPVYGGAFAPSQGVLTRLYGCGGPWRNEPSNNTMGPCTKKNGDYGSIGYVGFRFKKNGTGTYHLGWIELQVTDCSLCLPNFEGNNKVKIKSWAYNDVPDQGLLAGTTIALPVELISFDALLINESTQLKWQTASETNNAGFEIERSEDGKNYSSIAWVDGHGNSLEQQEYLFDDKNLRTGRTYYYRLKQVDYDGRFEYSDVVSVSLRNRPDAVGDFFPNPVSTGIASVEINSKEGGEWTVAIFDMSGKAIRTEKRFIEDGSAIFGMDMTGLSQGLYFVKFENRGERYYRKLVVE